MYILDDASPVPVDPPDCERGLDYSFAPPVSGGDPFDGVAEPFPRDQLIPRSQQKGIIEQMHRNGMLLSVRAREAGKPVRFQSRIPYCWGFGTLTGCEYINLRQNQKYVALSPLTVCGPVTGWRPRGGWAREAIEQISSCGAAPSVMMPDPPNMRSKSEVNQYLAQCHQRYTAEVQAEAMKRRCQEWWKLTPASRDPELCRDEIMSALIRLYPIAVELPWWEHLVCYVDPMPDLSVLFENSHGEEFGKNGFGVLKGQKMLPQGGVIPRVMTAA